MKGEKEQFINFYFNIIAGVKQETAFNPAMCELAGHLLIKGAQ